MVRVSSEPTDPSTSTDPPRHSLPLTTDTTTGPQDRSDTSPEDRLKPTTRNQSIRNSKILDALDLGVVLVHAVPKVFALRGIGRHDPKPT